MHLAEVQGSRQVHWMRGGLRGGGGRRTLMGRGRGWGGRRGQGGGRRGGAAGRVT